MKIPPKKSLGQHFLTNPAIIDKILRLAHLSPEDYVLEFLQKEIHFQKLSATGGPIKVIANLPYNIATEVFFRLLDTCRGDPVGRPRSPPLPEGGPPGRPHINQMNPKPDVILVSDNNVMCADLIARMDKRELPYRRVKTIEDTNRWHENYLIYERIGFRNES
jgi:hypothetical protein